MIPRVLALFSTLAVGGAERQLSFLAPGLRDRGFEMLVVTTRQRGRFFDELRAAGITTACMRMGGRLDARGALRTYRLWRTGPAIVLSQGLDARVLGHGIARRAHAAHVTIEQAGPGFPRTPSQRALARLVAPRVDRVVAVSDSQVPELRRLGYRDESIRVVANGSSEPASAKSRGEVRRELGLGEDEFVVLLAASLRPEKRPDVFVDAVAHARARNANVRGVMAGGGPLLEDVRVRAEALGDACLVLGERGDMPELMSCADAVCLSSDVEGIPLAALEAMALGRPLVATDVGGMPAVVDHGRTGMLVPPGDAAAFGEAILELAANPSRGASMGAEARARFHANFTAELMADRYAELLFEVARRPPAR